MLKAQRAEPRTIWMSRAEVARVLQVAPVTIGRWASQGKLPHSLTLGGRRRFRRDDIDAIARQLTVIVNGSHAAADRTVASNSTVRRVSGAGRTPTKRRTTARARMKRLARV